MNPSYAVLKKEVTSLKFESDYSSWQQDNFPTPEQALRFYMEKLLTNEYRLVMFVNYWNDMSWQIVLQNTSLENTFLSNYTTLKSRVKVNW